MSATPHLPAAADEIQADLKSLDEAAHWYAALYADRMTDERREAWARWLAERPEHRRAWAHIEAISLRFEPLRVASDCEREAAATAVQVSAGRIVGRRRVLGCLAAIGGTGAAGWWAWHFTMLPDPLTAWRSDYRTGIGERRDILLADGTRVWLNTNSAFDVDFDGVHRRLTLTTGEILIDTGKDRLGRPFLVGTPNGRMQALGTRFTVRQTDRSTLLSVFDGQVAIRNHSGRAEMVAAGRQRRFTTGAISGTLPADPAREAWSRGAILAEDVTLGALISELSRYQHGHIGVDPQVAGIRVFGRFPENDLDQTFAMLEPDLPIPVRHTLPWWITIEARLCAPSPATPPSQLKKYSDSGSHFRSSSG
ncbi:iron dicitrate transport regulator FecR [Burkholderia sp. SRS-46]|nr:iron dicitrate transport regulator FecR [Burkholderia sp. SRS-46]